MISRRFFRTIRRRCLLRKQIVLVIVSLVALYFWRLKSSSSSSSLNAGIQEVELELPGDRKYVYQYDKDEKWNEEIDNGDIFLENENRNHIEDLDEFEKVKRQLGIQVEEEDIADEEDIRNSIRVKDSLQNGKSKRNALNKLKGILGDDQVIKDPDEMDYHEGKEVAKKKGDVILVDFSLF